MTSVDVIILIFRVPRLPESCVWRICYSLKLVPLEEEWVQRNELGVGNQDRIQRKLRVDQEHVYRRDQRLISMMILSFFREEVYDLFLTFLMLSICLLFQLELDSLLFLSLILTPSFVI